VEKSLRLVLFGYFVIIAIGWAGSQTVALAADPLCRELRDRSEGVEQYADSSVKKIARSQGNTTHAQDEEEGRPLPKMSPIDYKRSWVKSVLPTVELQDQNALFFTVHNEEYPSTDPEVINLPFDVYWCLAAKGDVILLFDLNTAHYTMIASVDRERQTVDMIDRWPNILSEFVGTNPELFTAQSGKLTGSTLVRFTRNDFAQLFNAAITLDTPNFETLLKRTLPPVGWTPELQLAVGRSLLYAGKYKAFAVPAADLIIAGVRDAGRAGKRDLVEESIPAMFAALAISHSVLVSEGNEAAALAARRYRDQIENEYGSVPIQQLVAEDALRIAIAALKVDPETARFFLDQAIKKNPLDYRAFLFRSKLTYQTLQISPGASRDDDMAVAGRVQKDAESALQLIETREREIKQRRADRMQKRGVYWTRGKSAEDEDDAELVEMTSDRTEAGNLLNTLNIVRIFIDKFEGTKAGGQ
jgi:hypothetical protein